VNILSLCSGIAGLDLGVKLALPGARTICYVEQDDYCRRVLLARMSEGVLDPAPLWGDLSTFDGRTWRGSVDLVIGGWPCQDISNAGRREGIREGNRSGLWFEFVRVLREVRPRLFFGENVAALLGRGMEQVLGDLSALGLDAEWLTLGADDVGAPHRRKRVFLLAYARHDEPPAPGGDPATDAGPETRDAAQDGASPRGRSALAHGGGERREGDGEAGAAAEAVGRGSGAVVGDAPGEGRQEGETEGRLQRGLHPPPDLPLFPPGPADRDGWRAYLEAFPGSEPALCRGADGLSARVDRLRALGNACVPLQVAAALTLLLEQMND
jgi:DNA (cytosine-5)-methyltransferase 1